MTSTAAGSSIRDDDRPEVVRHRLEEYHSKTEPLIGYYEERHPAPHRRLADGRRGQRPDPRDAGGTHASRSRLEQGPSAMIIRKTPEEIDSMAAAGEVVARCLAMLRVEVPRRRHDRRARPGGGEVHPQPGRRARLQGLPGLPGLDLRLAELDGGARHSRARTRSSAATCSRSTSASSSTAGSPTPR